MNITKNLRIPLLVGLALMLAVVPLTGQVRVQCPGDLNGDGIPDPTVPGKHQRNDLFDPNVACKHITGGDGFVQMADGKLQYVFGFHDVTGIGDTDGDGNITNEVFAAASLGATFPAPTLVMREGQRFYLTLTNVGMVNRPDLFDPHTVHYHGFPQSSTIFDGLPESAVAITMGASFTYFYNVVNPGTFLYHCHAEATEHMQMGMLGSLYVKPGQDLRSDGTLLGTHVHVNDGDADNPPYGNFPGLEDVDNGTKGVFDEGTHHQYAYNDNDGSTRYDVDKTIQISGFDPIFHDASMSVQPLPFAAMLDRYHMINGRGYPDTVDTAPKGSLPENNGIFSQPTNALISAGPGKIVLLRISNVNITTASTLISPSLPMKVVGLDAKELAQGSTKLHYTTNSLNLGGGQSADVLITIPATATPGSRYFLYSANLNFLSNDGQDLGGVMTEILVE
ncbi:MAG: multicopper oxidase domain-containing protein [Acidobacteriota bacterium]